MKYKQSNHLLFRCKQVFAIAIFFLSTTFASSQTIYLINADGLWRFNLETCINEFIVEVEITNTSEIAFHPDGTLYGINRNGVLFTIDTITGDTGFVYQFSGQLFEAMTCSKAGILYITGRDGELWTYDTATGTAILLGNIGFGFAGDLTFNDGTLYMTSINEDLIVRVDLQNLSASEIVLTDAGGLGGGMYGIVTYAKDCNDVKLFGIVSGNFLVQELDLNTMTSDTVCTLDRLFPGAATTYEYKASDPIRISDTLIVDPDCSLANGLVTVMTIGGVPPYQYSINGSVFQSENIFSDLAAGIYNIEVQDSRGCSTKATLDLISQSIQLIDSISVVDETCESANGVITINTLDNGIHFYSIDGINFQGSNIFNNLDQGIYEIIVTNEAGCIDKRMVEVHSTPPVEISDVELTGTSCGLSNGAVEISTIHGTQINYAINGTDFQPENIFQQLLPGPYTITVKDQHGCMDELTVVVQSSDPLMVDSIEIVHPACGTPNGEIAIHITNGAGVLGYSLNHSVPQESSIFQHLDSGVFIWAVIDELGCLSSDTVLLLSDTLFSIEYISIQMADCGKTNGSIQYLISENDESITLTVNEQTYANTGKINDLTAGSYHLKFSDDRGCVSDTSVLIMRGQCGFIISNIFSPNGDGLNDYVEMSLASNASIIIKKFLIFDRWGNVLNAISDLQVTGQQSLWDGTLGGKEADTGVYTYIIAIEGENGDSGIFKGDITLIR